MIHSMGSGKRDGQGSNVQAWSGKMKLPQKAIGLLPSSVVGGLRRSEPQSRCLVRLMAADGMSLLSYGVFSSDLMKVS